VWARRLKLWAQFVGILEPIIIGSKVYLSRDLCALLSQVPPN